MKSLQFLILYFLKCVHCFNFDTDAPIIFNQPYLSTNEKTYFGYTVAMYPGDMINSEWIRIGAPKANDTFSAIANPGMVYNCKVSEGCKPIGLINSFQNQKAKWVNGWIGGTMDVSYHFKRHIVCGFHQYYITPDYRTAGSCYWSFLNSSSFYHIDPILNPGSNSGIKQFHGKSAYYYGQGEAGFSAHFPEDENELILGAPGVANWAGTSIRITDEQLEDPEPSKKRRKRELRHFKTVEVAEPDIFDANELHGYSVSSGYYYGKRKLYYANGSPKDEIYKGTVTIFEFRGHQQAIKSKQKIVGEQLGEYFGGCLASGDINNDNFDDLIIGAPFFKGSTYNEGRVYIYLGAKNNLKKSMVLYANNKNGQFGTSIMFMGDLDRDGYGEVAIGSPYENENTGSVYIYRGKEDGLDIVPSQKIIGKEIHAGLLGFGIAISKPADIDGNKFKDVAIGSYLSGHAVLLRSRPIVAVEYNFTAIPEVLQIDTKIFLIKICFSYSLYSEDSVDIKYAISMDKTYGRANIGSSKTISTNITIRKNIPNCKNLTVTLVNNLTTSDKNMPIQAFITYALDYPPVNKSVSFAPVNVPANKFSPVLDKYKSSQTSSVTDIPFTLGCAKNNECLSELVVDMEFPELISNKLLIGSRPNLKMIVTIKNLGENAYSTKLNLILPSFIFFGRTPPRCTSLIANEIICDIANPLRNKTEKSIEFDLDIKSLDQGLYYDSLEILSKIKTTSINLNPGNKSIILELSSEADITINGKSEQDKNYYGTSVLNSSLLTHEFKVEKFGVSPIGILNVTLKAPYKLQTNKGDIQFISVSSLEAYFAGQPMNCDIKETDVIKKGDIVIQAEDILLKRRRRQVEIFKNISQGHKKENIIINDEEIILTANKTLYLNCSTNGVTCFDVHCTFGPYGRNNIPASISLKMDVDNAKLIDMAKNKDVVLISTFGEVRIDYPRNFIQNGNRTDTVIISSILVNEDRNQALALWILILAIILGFILLSILILVLVKTGFFNRSKKEELENLKAAVTQEAKILEIIENSKSVDDELDPSGENQLGETNQPPVPLQPNSSQEHLIDN